MEAGRPRGTSAPELHGSYRPSPPPNLRPVSYFQAVRIYSALEMGVLISLIVVWVGDLGQRAQLVLGWTHGFGWILLCLLVARGCRRGIFPWSLLAATVSPLGPIGSTIGLEYLTRRRARGDQPLAGGVGAAEERRSSSSSREAPRV